MEDKNEFLFRVGACVRASLDRLYEPQAAECTMEFTEPKPAHDDVIKRVLYQHAQQLQEMRASGLGSAEKGDRGNADNEGDSDAERIALRDEPDDDRAQEDSARIDAILNSPENM